MKNTIGLVRLRFHSTRHMDPEGSIDQQLQEYLQKLDDNGTTIISVQQTHEQRVEPGNRSTYVSWIEVLIITKEG